MSPKIITSPTLEPLTVEEVKVRLRVVESDDDVDIAGMIGAVREGAEHITGRALMPQTLELALDGFSDRDAARHAYRIILPRPPLVSVTSVKYLDESGVLQTLDPSAYVLDDYNDPARLVPAYGTTWPATRCQPNAVLVRYVAGYADADAVPQQIKNWMLLHIANLYENRESVVTGVTVTALPNVDRLLDAYRIWNV